MNVLVLGGTRFIGPYVVRLLVEQEHEVTVFHRGETEADLPASVRHVHADFASLTEHARKMRYDRPDVVRDMVPYLGKDGHGADHFPAIARRPAAVSSCAGSRSFGRRCRTEPGPPDPVRLT